MKKTLKIVGIICLLAIVYVVLGWMGLVPLYHCDTAMGPNGLVKWCEWYPGPARTY